MALLQAQAQQQDLPENVLRFIPKAWVILSQATGDLNKDGLADLVVVLQNTDQKNIVINDGLGTDTLDANPRSLLIFFKDSISEAYKLITKNDSFILRHDEPQMDDPFSDIAIINGSLRLSFRLFYNAGSWYTSGYTYIFRYQKNEFVLIGAETSELHRASGESSRYSINFLTKKYSITKGNEFDAAVKPKTSWRTFVLKQPKTLNTFVKPFTWNFEGTQL